MIEIKIPAIHYAVKVDVEVPIDDDSYRLAGGETLISGELRPRTYEGFVNDRGTLTIDTIQPLGRNIAQKIVEQLMEEIAESALAKESETVRTVLRSLEGISTLPKGAGEPPKSE